MADVSRHLEKAEKLLQRERHDEALKELLRAVEEDPRHDGARMRAADLCAALHRPEEAAQLYSAAFAQQIALGDGKSAALTYKKLAHVAVPRVEQMLQYAALIERSHATEALATYRAAVDQLQQAGRLTNALEAQQRVIALDPNAEEYERLAQLQVATSNPAAAAESFLRAAAGASDAEWVFEYLRAAYEAYPSHPVASVRYGAALVERSQFAAAASVLGPVSDSPEAGALMAQALMGSGRLQEAEPYFWKQYEADRSAMAELGKLMAGLLAAGEADAALSLAHRLEVRETGHHRRRDFIAMVRDVVLAHPPRIDVLEYLAELLNSANREHDYCDVLGRLFDLYFASGQFLAASNSLDRAGEVDPYDQANQRRLERLRGKVDPKRYQAVAARFGKQDSAAKPAEQAGEGEQPTVLEDLMLQAEIFLQYGMRARAVERLQRISRLFPGEEANQEQLRKLFERANFAPAGGAPEMPSVARRVVPATGKAAAADATAAPARPTDGPGSDLRRVAEIANNIFRQANLQAMLFAAAHDAGRYFKSARCIVALGAPGAPPSAYAEYCAPGMERSEIAPLSSLIATCGKRLSIEPNLVVSHETTPDPTLRQACQALAIAGVAASRLTDRDEFAGMIIVGDAAQAPFDMTLLSMLAGQLSMAVTTARLRKLADAMAPREQGSGLLKRSSYFDALGFEITRALQQRTSLCVALMHFSHPAEAPEQQGSLGAAIQLIVAHMRQSDVAVRYGTHAIALVLANSADKAADAAVTKLRGILARDRVAGQLQVASGIAEAVLRADFDVVDIATEVASRAQDALAQAQQESPTANCTLPQPELAT